MTNPMTQHTPAEIDSALWTGRQPPKKRKSHDEMSILELMQEKRRIDHEVNAALFIILAGNFLVFTIVSIRMLF